MKSRRLSLPYSILCSAAVALALSSSAFADGGTATQVSRLLAGAEPDFTLELPANLNEWKDAADEIDLAQAHIVSLGAFPQGRLKTQPPVIDFDKWEIGGFLGMVAYSDDFEADPDYVMGITSRIPIPALPLGEWGVWGQLMFGHIRRDIPFYYPKSHGEWYGIMAGGDYTFLRTDLLFLRAQAGVMYAHWNDIHALDNGAGVIVGAEFGFFWIKHYSRASLTINPQLNFDGDNWIGLINFGFSYDF